MTTVNDVITEAWKKSGVLGLGQTMDGGDLVSGVADFNDMVNQWASQRWMTWGLVDVFKTSTGSSTYTVGPGGDFNVSATPTRMESAYQRQIVTSGLNVDTPLDIIPSAEEYSRLSLKALISFGRYAFLDTSTFPLATLRLYPIPNATIYQVHILLKNVIPTFTVQTIGTTLTIPAHYIAALKFNLAKRYRQAYGKGLRPDPELNGLARSSLDIVKQANLQVPELVMPKVLITQSSGYNILSDQF
jgi:hypothetical protein